MLQSHVTLVIVYSLSILKWSSYTQTLYNICLTESNIRAPVLCNLFNSLWKNERILKGVIILIELMKHTEEYDKMRGLLSEGVYKR